MSIPIASLRAVIGVDGDQVAAAKLTQFGARVDETATRSTRALGRLGVAAETVDHQLAHFGVPFSNTAGRVITSFERMESRGASLGSRLSNLGRTEATAAALGLAAVATEGVHLADSFELSHARLETAAANAGLEFDTLSGRVKTTDKNMEALGFTNAETESSLARLLTRTRNLADAQRDEHIAADLARQQNIDLATATKYLIQVEAGRYTLLSRSGLASKDQIAGFRNSADAIQFLANVTRGQAAAAAETFAGRMKVLSAEGKDLGATIGVAVVPKIESAAQVALTGVHAFQDFNSATQGLAGQTLGLAAAFPVAVFAGSKLIGAGKAIAGTYKDTAAWLQSFGTTTTATAASAEAAATAVATARQIEAAAAVQAGAAEKAFATALAQSAAAEDGDLGAAVALTAATDRLAAAKARLAVASEATAEAESVAAAESAAVSTGLSGVSIGLGVLSIAAVGAIGIIHAFGEEERHVKKDANDLTEAVKTQGVTLGQAAGQQVVDYLSKHREMGPVLREAGVSVQEFTNAIQHGGPEFDAIRQKIKDYEKELRDTGGNVKTQVAAEHLKVKLGELRRAYVDATGEVKVHNRTTEELRGAHLDATQSTGNLTDATNSGAGAMHGAAAAAKDGEFAYLGLASGASTAAQAIAQIGQIESSKVSPFQLQIDTGDAQAAIEALHAPPDTAAGGSGQTPTAAALEQTQKELSLRDALRSVGQATRAVSDAEQALSDARGQQAVANQAEIVAEKNLRNILQGVSADTKVARDAQLALTQARIDAANQNLNLAAAERALAHAKNDQSLVPFGVTDAQRTLDESRTAAASANDSVTAAEQQLADMRTSGLSTVEDIAAAEQVVAKARADAAPLNEQVTKNEVSLRDARIDAKAGDEAVTKAELDLKSARIDGRQKTAALDEAERIYDGTLHGFPKTSREARDAQKELTAAQLGARDATRQVRDATNGLVDAENQIPTAALGAARAQADLEGKLTAAAGGAGGMAKLANRADSMIVKLEQVRQKFIAVANDTARSTFAATGSVQGAILAQIQVLLDAVSAEPALQGAFDNILRDLKRRFEADALKHAVSATGARLPGAQVHLPGTATGGHRAPGETFTVGEEGYEIAHASVGGGVDILSNPQSRRALGTGSSSDGALLAEVRKLNDTLSRLQPLHVDHVGSTVEELMRELDKRDRRREAVANLIS